MFKNNAFSWKTFSALQGSDVIRTVVQYGDATCKNTQTFLSDCSNISFPLLMCFRNFLISSETLAGFSSFVATSRTKHMR